MEVVPSCIFRDALCNSDIRFQVWPEVFDIKEKVLQLWKALQERNPLRQCIRITQHSSSACMVSLPNIRNKKHKDLLYIAANVQNMD